MFNDTEVNYSYVPQKSGTVDKYFKYAMTKSVIRETVI